MDTRRKIMTAALKLFSEGGYHTTTVDDIARDAAVGKGTVYWHFSGKEALFEGLLEEMFTRYLAEIERIREEGGSILEQLERILELRITLIRSNQPVTRMILSRWEEGISRESHERFLAWRRRHQEVIGGLMREGADRRELRIESPELAAMAFTGMANELIMNPGVERPGLARELMDLLARGIARCPGED